MKKIFKIILFCILTTNSFGEGLEDGLVAYYPFNGNANNQAGIKNSSIIVGNPELVNDRNGNSNAAYRFDGIDDYIDAGNPIENNPQKITQSVWIKSNATQNAPGGWGLTILTKRHIDNGSDWPSLTMNGVVGNIGFGHDDRGGDGGSSVVDNFGKEIVDVRDGKWHHVVGVKDGLNYYAYLDGEIIFEIILSGNTPNGSTRNLHIGHHGAWGSLFKGSIDDVRIYDRALSSSEVSELYELEKPSTDDTIFSVIEGNFTWEEAKADAETRGGRLAVLNTSEVLAMANPVINSFAGSLWIGLSDSEKEGDWKWITGESLTFSNWEPGQPDSNLATEDYAHIFWSSRDSQRRWNDSLGDDPNVATGVGNINNDKGYLLEKNVSLNDGLVAYYPFNGNANDESGNANNGTVNGATLTADRNGTPSSAYNFDGNSWIKTSSDLRKHFPTTEKGMVISFWSKNPSNYTMGAYMNGSVQSSFFGIGIAESINRIDVYGNGTGSTNNGFLRQFIQDVDFSKWNHWVVRIFSGELGSSISLNGNKINEGTIFLNNFESSVDFYIGGFNGGKKQDALHNGLLDDIRIYNRDLSEEEINEIYELEKPTQPDPSPPVVSFDAFYEALPDETITIDATPESGFPEDFTYQWYFGTFLIPEVLGGKSNTFDISSNDENNGIWTVKISNSAGSTGSSFYFAAYKDTDGDGISDGREEYVIGSDPTLADTDGDGLKDYDEVYTYGTSFSKPDTDGDGFDDIFEINTKYDPLNKESTPEAYLEIQTAVEIKFNAGKDLSYKIENSVDLENWNAIEAGVIGEGKLVKRLYSIDDYKGRYFRVRREN